MHTLADWTYHVILLGVKRRRWRIGRAGSSQAGSGSRQAGPVRHHPSEIL